MLCMELIGIYCENNTKHIHAICGQNAELRSVTAHGSRSSYRYTSTYHWALKGYKKSHSMHITLSIFLWFPIISEEVKITSL